MSKHRLTKAFINGFPKNVVDRFDKYVGLVNAVTFCPLQDIYEQAPSIDTRKALKDTLQKGLIVSFWQVANRLCLVVPGGVVGQHETLAISFDLPPGPHRPWCAIKYEDLPHDKQEKLRPWIGNAYAYQALRRTLYARCSAMLQTKPEKNTKLEYGCKTIGQVYRLWPELLSFFPRCYMKCVRELKSRPRLPAQIYGYGTPEEFNLEKRPRETYRYDPRPISELPKCKLVSDEEWEFKIRELEKINCILIQASLMEGVPYYDDYPRTVFIGD